MLLGRDNNSIRHRLTAAKMQVHTTEWGEEGGAFLFGDKSPGGMCDEQRQARVQAREGRRRRRRQ